MSKRGFTRITFFTGRGSSRISFFTNGVDPERLPAAFVRVSAE
jgi:hypothetical protein